jgi:hypothetical protein
LIQIDGEAEENNKKVVTSTRSACTRDAEFSFFLKEVETSGVKWFDFDCCLSSISGRRTEMT